MEAFTVKTWCVCVQKVEICVAKPVATQDFAGRGADRFWARRRGGLDEARGRIFGDCANCLLVWGNGAGLGGIFLGNQ